ncbi:undecaprenyl-phosphate glucose phosphotransferase [Pontibacter silvestris]|uniref:Undecaprenyl-phosphate glucose phosphotransferase n=1 Tax=Pontibacter silvestris TaxID=2305183 RepID=A0ABW4WSE5_9BACT|nr:undecaprenyl-phosphate glucose phosphotransferase [Pontibacter silvestris]MCC9137783.1 undecaprenyl-phosphate glucose phosphotransferase [Pontibacter silvestris]
MPSLYSKYIKLVHTIGDTIAITLSTVIAFSLTKKESSSTYYLFLFCALIGWLVCTSLLGTYKFNRATRRFTVILIALKAVLLYIVLVEASINITNKDFVLRKALVYHYLFLACLVVLWRFVVTTALRIYRKNGYNYRKVVIIGHNEVALELEHFFQSYPEYGYHFLGFFDNKIITGTNLIGKVSDIEEFIKKNKIDEIYCCPFELKKQQISWLMDLADNNLVRIKFLPEPETYTYQKLKIDFYDMLPVLIVRSIPLDDVINKAFKRSFDLIFSLLVVVLVLSWLIPILAFIIRIDSKGPIFFRQERSGINNKKFWCWKFRSMYVNSEANSQQARKGDPRITPVGAFLRKTSLDELPQFFNVLMGQMSVVGPRPHMLKHTQEYSLVVDKFMVRHFIKPGITGLSQVRGLRGDTSEVHQMKARVKLDIFYLENWSMLLDLKIIFFTVYNIFRGDKHAF